MDCRKCISLLFIKLIILTITSANDDNDIIYDTQSHRSWEKLAITLMGAIIIMIAILLYILSINKRLRRRIKSLEEICVVQLAKDKPYNYNLSSDDEYDELNPFISDEKKNKNKIAINSYQNDDNTKGTVY